MDMSEIEEMMSEAQQDAYNEAVDEFISEQGVSTFYVQEELED